ncbi:hypothetical protein BTS2_0171 [Bacillus sp. TS-2]|nr:hypothetical protein BTS2_0171 [Bacillus sp. TS-2]
MRVQRERIRKVFIFILIFLFLITPYGQVYVSEATAKELQKEIILSVEGTPSHEQVILIIESEYSELEYLEIKLNQKIQYDENKTKELEHLNGISYDNNILNIRNYNKSLSEKVVLTNLDSGENVIQVIGYLSNGESEIIDYVIKIDSNEDTSKEAEDDELNNNDKFEVAKEGDEEDRFLKQEEASLPHNEANSLLQEETNQYEEETIENQDDLIFTPMVGNLNVDIDISPLNANVLAGNDAAYKLVFKTTGSITEYTNATITVDLPLSNEVGFNQSLSELHIAGVEPTFDAETNQLVYQFDALQAGQTYENIIKLTTTNGLIANGTELEVQASFEAEQFDTVQDLATVVIDASTSISASKRYTEARGNDRNIPIPNAQTVWEMKVDIPKNSIGQNYLEPGSQITVVDTLPNGLSYHSMVEGPEPERNGNILTWTFEAPSIEEQEAAEDTLFNTELEVVLTVGNNTVDQTLINNVDVTAQFIGDENENTTNANHSVTIADSDRATGEIRGNVFVPSHFGPRDDRGNRGPNDNKDPNPIVYDDAWLGFAHNISPLHESNEGDFRNYTTAMNIDENLIFKEVRTSGSFIYRPTNQFPPGVPFQDPPRFNIEADIDGERVVLIENAEVRQTYSRADLGIGEDARVSAIYLNFTHAPSGMGGVNAQYFFEPNPGYVGNVTNVFDVFGTGGNGTVFGNNTNGRQYGTVGFFNNVAGPRSAQIAPRPTNQSPIATVDVELTNHQGSYVDFGDNRMRVNLNTENSSTLAMSEPLEAMVLLPPGVTISDDPDAGFTDADGRASNGSHEIVSNNYNDTGRQLVTFNWTDRLLRPGNNVASEINIQINGGAANVLTFDVYGFSGDESLTVPSVDNPGQTDTVLQTDSEDLNENGNTEQPRLKSGNEYYMSGQYNIQTEKLVRGELDDAFTTFGRTVPGGGIDYQLTLTNTTGSTISTMTLMDVLPSIGDLGITDNIDRGSQFTPQLAEAIQLPSQWTDRVDVYYSTALTPERDDLIRHTNYPDTTEQLSNPEGVQAPNWVLASEVDDWSSIHSFKIELSEGVEWIDGEDIAIAFSMIAPEAADVELSVLDKTVNPTQRAAWNSFAIATDQGQPVEPARVGVYMDLDNSVQLTKQSEDGELLEGAVFTLFNEAGEEVATGLTTDENGILFIEDLLPGNYELVETQAPAGYVLDATPIPFIIDLAVQQLIELTKENSPVPGSVELSKVGEDGETLEGAVFSLFDSDDNELQTGLTTNEEGLLVVEDLVPGNYYFVETEAPFGYVLDDTPLPFDIVFNQEAQVEVTKENTLIPGAVELTKEDEDGTILEGVEFELQDRDGGNTIREGLLTDEEGKLFINDLTPGSYQLVETATLPGYELDPTPIPFEIGLGQTTVTEVSFVNEFTPGSVGLTKVGESGDTLEGAVFSLFDSEDNELQTGLTTNEEGRLVVEELAPGSYYFVETEAPFGYVLDDTPLAFDIDFNQEVQLELTRENLLIPGAVELTKVDEEGVLLEGVEFELQDRDGNVLREGLLTDEEGILFIDDLTPGSYQLVETATLPGYELNPTPIPFEIGLGETTVGELSFINEFTPGSVSLTKVGQDEVLLEGAAFSLFDAEDNELQTGLTTNEDGQLVVEDLAPGTYYFVETEAPFGYELDDTPLEFEIIFNQDSQLELTKENTVIPGAVELTKEDEEGTFLEGVEFELQDSEGNTLREALLTDEEGKLLIDELVPGSYQLVETATLPGYELNPTPIPFEITLGQTETVELSFVNEFSPGSVGLTKVGETGETLEGAVFSLFDAEDNELQTGLTTDEDGRIVVENLEPGSYYFVETEAPFGYELDDTPLEFEIVFNQEEQLELTKENTLIPGAIELTKEDEDGTVLEGVEFELQDSEGNTLREGLLTNEEGKLLIDDLAPGNYQLIETATLPGYELDPTPIVFEIGLGETTVGEISFVNEFTPGSVGLTKVDEEGETLEGAVFSLFDAEDNELETGLTTNEEGRLVLEDLAPGNYYFVETEAPFGYELDSTPLEFEIVFNQEAQLEVTKENVLILGSVVLTKVNENGTSLEGVEFELQDTEGNTLREGLLTDENGVLLLDDLAPGSYQFVETATIPGYVLDPTPISFEIELGPTDIIELNFVNEYTLGSVGLTKVDEEGETLEGAVFSLFDAEDNELQTGLTINEEGRLVVEELAPGTYYFVETEAPFGYKLDSTPLEFDIVFNQEAQLEVIKENSAISGAVELTKVDEEGETLEGAVFTLYDSEDNELQTGLTTDEEGKLVVNDLSPGSYYFVETEAPFGYQIDETPRLFEVEFNQREVVMIEVVNELILGHVTIIKVDSETDVTLQGAEFEIRDGNDQVVETVTTNDLGLADVQDLTPGDYQLFETKAPEGYQQLVEAIEFTVQVGMEETLELFVQNTKLPPGESTPPPPTETPDPPTTPAPSDTPPTSGSSDDVPKTLPQTGEEWFRYLLIAGSLLIIVGSLLIVFNRRKVTMA